MLPHVFKLVISIGSIGAISLWGQPCIHPGNIQSNPTLLILISLVGDINLPSLCHFLHCMCECGRWDWLNPHISQPPLSSVVWWKFSREVCVVERRRKRINITDALEMWLVTFTSSPPFFLLMSVTCRSPLQTTDWSKAQWCNLDRGEFTVVSEGQTCRLGFSLRTQSVARCSIAMC